jgi:hypothetical protein
MHTKLRCDALWNTFTPEQKQKLEEWLVEKNLGIRQVHKRVQDEFGITCVVSTIGRISQYLNNRGAADEVEDAQLAAEELASNPAKLDKVRRSSMTMIGVRLFQKTTSPKASVKELATLGRIVLDSQERQIQQDRVDLARERFQFKAAQAAMEALPLAEKMRKEDHDREQERVDAMRRHIFRKELDKIYE